MKKLFSIFVLLLGLFTTQCLFVSCEKDDDEPYYAGESADDYRPATYSISSDWDFNGVSGITSQQKAELKANFEKEIRATGVYNTRKDAVKEFDDLVSEMRNTDFQFKGAKCKIYLKRGSAIIKSATLSW
ncbi:MAG: hypothetical protein K2K82_03850 [Muribaculaceae bacterium]|nr:hypothetical protein [Muribaculaceae bacterium]